MNRENIYIASLALAAIAAVAYMVYDHYAPTETAQLNGTFTCIYATEGATCAYIPSKISKPVADSLPFAEEFRKNQEQYYKDNPPPVYALPNPNPLPDPDDFDHSPTLLGTWNSYVLPPSKICARNPNCVSI